MVLEKQTNKQIDQWNQREDQEVNPDTYGHLIFDKEAKNVHWTKVCIFNK